MGISCFVRFYYRTGVKRDIEQTPIKSYGKIKMIEVLNFQNQEYILSSATLHISESRCH